MEGRIEKLKRNPEILNVNPGKDAKIVDGKLKKDIVKLIEQRERRLELREARQLQAAKNFKNNPKKKVENSVENVISKGEVEPSVDKEVKVVKKPVTVKKESVTVTKMIKPETQESVEKTEATTPKEDTTHVQKTKQVEEKSGFLAKIFRRRK